MKQEIDNKNTPNCEGVWEWQDDNGNIHLMEVYNVGTKEFPHLRVYFNGSYYNVNDTIDNCYDMDGSIIEKDIFIPAEWQKSWKNRIADNDTLPENRLYLYRKSALNQK